MLLTGTVVRDVVRARVGRVVDVLLDPATHDARWLLIALDDDPATVLVPAAAATEFASGEIVVPYPSATIASATHERGRPVDEVLARALDELYGFQA